ncbi:MAG TPA: membrane dipeptidase [Syntrophomonadaceae bacterium]|jgi:membrane dipeptidase|nr:membrane dipeptidase [Syntrophomonadaceae bacterium]
MNIIDLHCDTVSRLFTVGESFYSNSGQFDIKRARQAGVLIQYFALFARPGSVDVALRTILLQIEYYQQSLQMYQEYLYPIYSYQDIMARKETDKIGCILHLEGADCISNDLELINILYRLGLRSLGLTWNQRNMLADGVAEDPQGGGLSKMGRKLLEKINEMNVMLDLAHISERGFYDVLEHYQKPVFVTHANARALCSHPRNLNDQQLKALAENGGIIGITQVEEFVSTGSATVDAMLDHIAYIADLIGVKHIALGSDFDGADNMVVANVSGYSQMKKLLQDRGFTKQEIEAILNKNALRTMQRVL